MRRAVTVLALVIMALCLVAPLCSDSSDGALDPYRISEKSTNVDGQVEISAGSSSIVFITIVNNDTSEIEASIQSATIGDGMNISPSEDTLKGVRIPANDWADLQIEVTIDRYAHAQLYQITLQVLIVYDSGNEARHESVQMVLLITSPFASGDQFNRILGIWASPFNEPIYAALITLVIWVCMAFVLSYLVIPAIMFLFIKEDREHKRTIRHSVWKSFFILIMLVSLSLLARIYGIGEEPTAVLDSIVNIAYILVGALIVWQIYKTVVAFMIGRMAERNKDGAIDNSLIPLMEMIGKIIIATAAVASVLSALGFDLVMILTGAGLVGLAISLGAQNTLSQFFSGIALLATRPFVKGDFVRIDGGDVLKVRRVGIMSTEFDDWSSNSLWVMPNNKVATSTITNITGKTVVYKVNIFIGMPKNTDIDLAKKLMLEAAMEHPRVVKSGSFDMPYSRVDSFEESNIKLRLSVFVEDFNDSGTIAGQIRESILNKFSENGLGIELPTDIVIHKDE